MPKQKTHYEREEAVQGDGDGEAPAPESKARATTPGEESAKERRRLRQAEHGLQGEPRDRGEAVGGGGSPCLRQSDAFTRARSAARFSTRRRTTGPREVEHQYAKEQVEHSLTYAYRDRKNRKRTFRRLWIQRINPQRARKGSRTTSSYHGLREAGIELDRKVLARDRRQRSNGFKAIAGEAKAALEKSTAAA